MKSVVKNIILIACFLNLCCLQSCVNEVESAYNPMLEFVAGEDGEWFELSSPIKAATSIEGDLLLKVKYKNGFSREVKVTLNTSNGELYTDDKFFLSEGAADSELQIPLYGKVDNMGEFSLGITFKPLKESPISKTIKLFANDPFEEFSFNWDGASVSDKIYDNIENSTVLSIPYSKGYGRNVVIDIKSNIGLSGSLKTELNGNYEDKVAGENGIVEIPLIGTPSTYGDAVLNVTVTSPGLNISGTVSIKVDENSGEFPATVFDADVTVNGHAYKNLKIGNREPVSLALIYENGFAREVLVAVNEKNGISATEFATTLKAGSGKGRLDIPLEGIPAVLGENILEGYVKLKETGEKLADFNATIDVLSPGKINIGEVKLKDELFDGASANTAIQISYTNGYNREATVTADLSEGSGLIIEPNTLFQLSESGVLEVKVIGDNLVAGNYPCEFTITTEGEEPVVISYIITITDSKPAIDFVFSKSEITGAPVLKNQEVNGTVLKLYYVNGFDRTIKSIGVNGMLTAMLSDVVLAGSEGFVEVPLSGVPAVELGKIDISIKVDDVKEKLHSMSIFAGEQVTWRGLDYCSIFIDVNGNGAVDSGEIWLDRNIGATSTDPGEWGELKDNRNCIGHYYYWGKSYTGNCSIGVDGHPEKDESYQLPATSSQWKDICPEGYHVPLEDEWRFLFNYLVGTAYVAAPAAPRVQEFADKTPEDLMKSNLRLPMGGIHDAKSNNPSGTTASYWSSTWFNNKPVKVNITLKPSGVGQTNIAVTNSETAIANVRCVKD